MTVLDASGAIDYLLGWSAAEEVERLLSSELRLPAPDILIFEVISALRRQTLREQLTESRRAGRKQRWPISARCVCGYTQA